MQNEKIKKTIAKKNALLAGRSTVSIIEMWELTEAVTKPNRDLAMVRGWLMEELERRDPLAYNAWIDGYYGDDAKSARRAFIRPHFYYQDNATNETKEYESERAFWDGILWNRDVAEEYGDDVPSEPEIREMFRNANEQAIFLNGAYFIKTVALSMQQVKAGKYSIA